jgi:glutathione synthase
LIANDISRFFKKIFNLRDLENEGKLEVLNFLRENYNDYIVKPNKEGGSHNYYGEDILNLLQKNLNLNSNDCQNQNLNDLINPILLDSIIMEKINPPSFNSYILKENKLYKKECVSEVSIFGIILSKPEGESLINKSTGFLVRTKGLNDNEGGCLIGISAIDLPALID